MNRIVSSTGKASLPLSVKVDFDFFWSVVNQGRLIMDEDEKNTFLVNELSKYSTELIIDFEVMFRLLLKDLNNNKVYNFIRYINGFTIPDDLLWFGSWVVSAGKDIYDMCKVNPDSLVLKYPKDFILSKIINTSFIYISDNAYLKRINSDIETAMDLEVLTPRIVAEYIGVEHGYIESIEPLEDYDELKLINEFPNLTKILNK